MRILLIGMKHVGKSTIGRTLAYRHDRPFIDLDDEIIRVAAAETTRPLARARDVYETLGEERFRRIEAERLAAVCADAASGNAVIALGGGALEDEVAADVLSGAGAIVYLREDPRRLWRRVSRTGVPAYLRSRDPESEFLGVAERRDRRFREIATAVVELSGGSVEEAVARVETALSGSHDAG